MIIYEYDGINGEAVADGRAEEVVAALIARHEDGEWVVYGSGTDNVLHALRVAVRRGRIAHTDVSVRFQGVDLGLDADGRIREWPAGFADYMETWLMALL